MTFEEPVFWIIGGGKFGSKAADKLKKKHPLGKIIVIDDDVETFKKLKQASYDVLYMDGISFLDTNLSPEKYLPDWIVPAAPIHTAYQWVRKRIEQAFILRPESVPDDILSQLPNPIIGKNHEVYMSLADFICPDNCPEPAEVCTITQKPRPYALFERLLTLTDDDFLSLVIQSQQLAPGVGGYEPDVLFSALERVKQSEKIILFSTACRCHGVMNAFSLKRRVAG